jgi:adenylate cyclase
MALLRWIAASGLRVALLVAGLVGLYHVVNELRVLAGAPRNFHQRLELTALDVKFSFRGDRPPEAWKVAIAAVDEKAIRRFGPPPWKRTVHAALVERLTQYGAASVAFDMTFEQPSPTPALEARRQLVEALDASPLERAQKELDGTAAVLERLGPKVAAARRLPNAPRVAQSMEAVALSNREVASTLGTFRRGLTELPVPEDPDAAFAEAIRRSGRVVLGVVALSRAEADSVEYSEAERQAALRLVASSTISELVVPGPDGMDQVAPGAEPFERGLYRRYFGLQAPTAALARATRHFATLNAAPDDDGVNRRVPLVSGVKGTGVLLPTLAVKGVEVARSPDVLEVVGAPDDPSPQRIQIGALQVPTELMGTTTLDWYGRFERSAMPIISIADIVDGTAPQDRLQGKVVFVAATAIGTHDQRVTPLERAVPGVYIHATLAQNILDQDILTRPVYVVVLELVVILLIGLISGLVMTRFHLLGQLLTAAGLVAGWTVLDTQLLFRQGLVVYTVLPVFQVFITLLGVTMWSFLVEQRERRKTRQAFGRYLSPKVMEQVLSNPEEYLRLGGRRYEATVLFSDIRGFTTISEALTPEALGMLLNQYMTPMTDIVFEHDGTLDKYIGDAVMAFWGAPVALPNHALSACKAALQMIREVERLNERFQEEGLPHIAIGIGLSSGPMTIGNMGSDDHFAYTALGDRVNLGARLEGQTKEYGVDILISEDTQAMVKDEMLCRELGALQVKGKLEPVHIYELVGPRAENAHRETFVSTFHEGLACFRTRRFEEAVEHFQRARALAGLGGDKSSDLYLRWCHEYRESPPPEDWDGVRVATTK